MFDASLSTFQPISVSMGSKSARFGAFLTVFRDFLNANYSETAEASPLKLRLLRRSPRGYERARSELSRSNSKKITFRTFDRHSEPGR
jgi:hypothetical protein